VHFVFRFLQASQEFVVREPRRWALVDMLEELLDLEEPELDCCCVLNPFVLFLDSFIAETIEAE